MGCDIHMYLEYKIGDGPWQADRHHIVDSPENCLNQEEKEPCDPCLKGNFEGCYNYDNRVPQISSTGRNYGLFGALAGVRCEGPEALGFPADASPTIVKAYEEWDSDGHSHSYISLEDFKRVLVEQGFYKDFSPEDCVSTDAFYDWRNATKGGSRPVAYITTVNYAEKLISDISAEEHLLGDNRKVQVRLVFWFDN